MIITFDIKQYDDYDGAGWGGGMKKNNQVRIAWKNAKRLIEA